jgi:hypothetical protein
MERAEALDALRVRPPALADQLRAVLLPKEV